MTFTIFATTETILQIQAITRELDKYKKNNKVTCRLRLCFISNGVTVKMYQNREVLLLKKAREFPLAARQGAYNLSLSPYKTASASLS